MPTKLYVGNLAYSVTNEDLEGLFSQAGKVESAVVVSDKFSGQSRGSGFVEMADSNDAARAIEEFNETELKGRNIRVNEARPREGGGGGGPRGGGGGYGGPRGGGGGGGGGGWWRRRRRWPLVSASSQFAESAHDNPSLAPASCHISRSRYAYALRLCSYP